MAYSNRGAAYIEKCEFDKAIADCDRAIELDPELAMAYSNRGAAYIGKGEPERAIEDCNRAIELDPECALAYNNRGSAYAAKGEFDKGIDDSNMAIDLDPQLAKAYLVRGFSYLGKGEIDVAMADFDMAIELDPNDAYAYFYRGLAYLVKHEFVKARSDMKSCVELSADPQLVEMAQELRNVRYWDDFSGPQTDWLKESSRQGFECGYVGGEYHILVDKFDSWYCVWSGWAGYFTDFTLEIDARLVSGPEESEYGVIFRLRENDSYYVFLVTGTGYYIVGKRTEGAWTTLKDWTWSASIAQGYSINHLKVVCQCSEIEVYVNDYYLTTVTDDSFDAGAVGMIVDTPKPNTRVAFDNIVIYSLTPTPTPAPTPTLAPTPTPTPPSEYKTYTGDVEGKQFSISYPSGWAEDSAEKAVRHDYYKSTSVAGYTIEGDCLFFYRSPGKDAYVMVATMDPPLPVTVDTVLTGSPFDDMFPGYVEISQQIIDELQAMHVFACNEGKAKQLVLVKASPLQVWYVTCMADEAAFDGYEPIFDHILDSFTLLS